MSAWLAERNVVGRGRRARRPAHTCGFEEVVLHLDGDGGRVELPFAIVADRPAGRADRRAAHLLQQLAADRPPREPPAAAAARPRAARVGRRRRVPARARGGRRRRDRRHVRAATATPERRGRRRPRHGGGPRLLRAAVLERRRHPARALRGHRRRAGCARWSTTSCAGARRSCRRRPGSPSTSAGRAASSPRPGSTTTPTRRSMPSRVPAVEGRVVAGVPGLAQPGSAEVPVGADLARDRAQVVPQVDDRRAPPEPVAVVDAVDDQPGLEHERVRDHRVVLGVGVLLDVEVLLDDAPRVGEERPLGADRRAELLERRGGRRSRSWRSACRRRRSSDRTRRARGAAGAPSGSSGRARA